jgi:hypothetical protein
MPGVTGSSPVSSTIDDLDERGRPNRPPALCRSPGDQWTQGREPAMMLRSRDGPSVPGCWKSESSARRCARPLAKGTVDEAWADLDANADDE